MDEISLSLRVLIGLAFVAAAWGKAANRSVFRGVVANYRLLPDFLVAPFALALPAVEAAVGLSLPGRTFAPWPEIGAAGLLLLFAAAMAVNIRRGRRHIDCGCFQSAHKQTLSWTLVARNLALAVLALLSAGASLPASLWELGEGLLAGTVAFLLLQSLNLLWSVRPAWRQPHAHHGGTVE